MHTDVRRLSRGDSSQRLVDLHDSSEECLKIWSHHYDEQKQCKNHLFYKADLYSKFNKVQMCLQGKNATIIQDRTVILGIEAKNGVIQMFTGT